MKHIIHERSGSAYTKRGNDFIQMPLSAKDNSFSKKDSAQVTDWESPSMKKSVEKAWEKAYGKKKEMAKKMNSKDRPSEYQEHLDAKYDRAHSKK